MNNIRIDARNDCVSSFMKDNKKINKIESIATGGNENYNECQNGRTEQGMKYNYEKQEEFKVVLDDNTSKVFEGENIKVSAKREGFNYKDIDWNWGFRKSKECKIYDFHEKIEHLLLDDNEDSKLYDFKENELKTVLNKDFQLGSY